jgi:hypothetical protein
MHDKNLPKQSLNKFYTHPGALLVTLLLILIGGIIALKLLPPKGQRIDSSTYQIVYLNSGQVYFGKLQNTTGHYLVLNEPYAPQSVDQHEEGHSSGAQPSTTLVKVSHQHYGPQDVMSIHINNVMFWQNLRSDSKIVQAINKS